MTEDDTFRILTKITFEQMQAIFEDIRYTYTGSGHYPEWAEERERLAKQHGWTVTEWQHENYIRLRKDD